jgi:hypothetical protein
VNAGLSTADGAQERRSRQPRRRTSTFLAVAAVALLFAPYAWFLLDRPDDLLPAYPFTEDAFYYFAVADHFSRGQIDVGAQGEYENGFQPLQAVLLTPVMLAARLTAGGDYHYAALRWFAVVELILVALVAATAAAVVFRLDGAGSITPGSPRLWLAILLGAGSILVNPRLVETLPNGQETALLVLGVLVLLGLLLARRPCRGETVLLPVVCGLVVLARVDAVVLAVGALIVWEVMRRRRSALLLRDWGLFALTCGWWFVLNLVKTGSPVPSSGAYLMRGTVPVDVSRNVTSILNSLASLSPVEAVARGCVVRALQTAHLPVDSAGAKPVVDGLFALGYWTAVALALLWLHRRARGPLARRRLLPLVPLAAYCLSLILFYSWFFAATWFIKRYLAPIDALATVAEATLAVLLLERVLAARVRWRLVAVAVVLLLAVPLARRHVTDLRDLRDPEPIPTYARHYALVRDLPASARVASLQTGVLSYFRPTTINLDGKMNRDALTAVRSGTLLDYTLGQDIEYVVEWEWWLDRYMPPEFDQHFEVIRSILEERLWRRKD